MYTRTNARPRRAAVVVGLLLAALSLPGLAQQACNGNPMARINPAQQTNVAETTGGLPTVVTLNGTSSTPNQASFAWIQLSGPAVTLSSATAAAPTFSAPAVGPLGATLQFRLTLTCGTRTDTALASVTITDVATNAAPTAVALATPGAVDEGDLVTLDGTGSYDIDNSPPTSGLTYAWEQLGADGLPASGGVALSPGATSAVATFTAPNNAGSTGGSTLRFRLTVRDAAGLAGTAETQVTVRWVNDPPVASLSCPEVVDEGDAVLLDGSGSSDSDDGIASFAWAQDTGLPAVDLGAPEPLDDQAGFIAPSLGYNQLGSIQFSLTVTDATGDFDRATCSVFIRDVTAPVLVLPAPMTVEATSAAGAVATFTAHVQDAVEDESPYALPDSACAPPSGSTFPLGAGPSLATDVECSAADGNGNTATDRFAVTVRDSTPPSIDVPGSYAIEAAGPGGSIANYGAIATSDAVDGAGTADCTPATGTLFPVGTTPVECSTVDARGNAASAGFPVVVHDLTPPVFDAVADVTYEATSAAGALANYPVPGATDLVDGPVAVTCLPAPGGVFPLGITPVACSATDGSGNTAQAGFDVVVRDTTPPTLTLPASVTAEATSAAGAIVTFPSSALDLVDGALPVTCVPASGDVFPLGATQASCSATDTAGNTANGQFEVQVVDTTPPVIDPHADVGPIEATGPGGAQVFYGAPGTSDAVDGAGVATCEPASGTIFAIGATDVDCTASDAAGNAATPTRFQVTVHDTTAPEVTPPANVGPVEATGALTPVAHGTATATDAVGVVEQGSDAPAAFPVGTTTITWFARDAAGNTGQATSTVTVVDTTPPVIDPMADILGVEATGPQGAVVSYANPATTDLVDGAGTASCTPASGSTFALGTTPVSCTASDTRGNAAEPVTFQVGVVDTTAPVVTPPSNVVREATGPLTAVALGSAGASDAVGVTSTWNDAPAGYPLGTTTVTWYARDAAGNTGSATSTVTIVDTTPPAFAPYADVEATATAGSQAAVHFTLPTAVDLVDGPVAVSCSHASGAMFPAGTTTVTCTARDGRTPANQSSMSFRVFVNYAWTGFFRPIDNPPVVNTVKAGSAVPVKFSLGGDQGLAIFEAGYPRSGTINCTAANQDEVTETVTAGQSSLSYDADAGQYIYVWKTEKSWRGCRALQVKLRDGRSYYATFQFR